MVEFFDCKGDEVINIEQGSIHYSILIFLLWLKHSSDIFS